MEVVIGLLLMLLGVSHGVETYCDGRKNNGTQCYGALGRTVVLQLMDSASEIFKYEWLKNKTTSILRGGKNRGAFNLIADRSSFTPSDGTFRINNLSWTDGGEYTLRIFDSNGRPSELRTLQLIIQAPVSSVLLVSDCLSQGETRVSCSSEGGDSPQYSWTLDGHTLTDTQLLSGNNETNNITLKPDVSGQLVCSVRNHISNVLKEARKCSFINCTLTNGTNISEWMLEASDIQCIKPTTITDTTVANWPILAGVLSALVILLVVGVAVISVHMKKQNNKPKEQEDDQELTYADVRIMQRQGRQTQQRAEVEVEYGQVKFSERPRQAVEPTADDCVYSQVRKGR